MTPINTINTPNQPVKPKMRKKPKIILHIPTSIQDVKENFCIQALAQTTLDFCRETTLHGIKHVVIDIQELGASYSKQKRIRKLLSLIIWTSAVVMGAVFAIVLMGLVWNRFQTTPTITTVETNNYPIWNVPFPAVTICNINKVYAPAAKNITQKLEAKGLKKEQIYEFLEHLAKLITPEYVDSAYLKTYTILQEMGYTTDRLMAELMQPCANMIHNCEWLGKHFPCSALFRVARSSEGYCCSFNYKAVRENLEVKQNATSEQITSPIYRVSGAGENVGLNLRIEVEKEQYVAYSKSFYGAKILIHDAENFPQTSVTTTTIGQPGSDLTIAVIPSVIVSEPGIRSLNLKQRNCLFDNEKKLRSANKYSFQSCMTECTVDTIVNKCDCLPFYYPESEDEMFQKKFKQCSLNDVRCLYDNRHVFSSLKPPENTALNETGVGMDCNCLPTCSELRYDVQATLSRRNPEDKLNVTTTGDNVEDLETSTTLKVHFKDLTCIKYRRDMYMTWDGLFAAFGGIFGLCLGGSVISLVELLYFFTLRLYSKIIGKHRQPDSKRVSISNNIEGIKNKIIQVRPKFLQHSKFNKFRKWSNPYANGILMAKTPVYDYNKANLGEFLP